MPPQKAGAKFLLRALRHKNYRLFFAGEGISLIGSWMQMIAVAWLVYRLSGSAFLLGVVGFFGQCPMFFLAPIAGVFADRWNCKTILVVTQTLAMIQAFILAALCFTGVVTPWQVIILSFFLGMVNAFDMPVRHTFVVELVDHRADLSNAIALNSLIFNLARLVGPAIAGVLIAQIGEGSCFFINGVSFCAVIAALVAITVKDRPVRPQQHSIGRELVEGFHYAARHASIRNILLLIMLTSVVGMSHAVLMPIFAGQIIGGGSAMLGFLMGAIGIGALGGAMYLAVHKEVRHLPRLVTTATFIFGASLIVFALSRTVWLALGMLVVVGFGMMVQIVGSNTLLQHMTDDDKRGRIMSLYTTAFLGMAPVGSIIAGALASAIGAPLTVCISGIICLAGGVYFSRRITGTS